MKVLIPALCLLLAACSQSVGMGNDDDALFNVGGEPMMPGTRPVRIGEGGPAFAACANVARVVNISAEGETYLPVRAAPFLEASEVLRLPNDSRLLVCTRSIDQRWQGVVVPPASAPDTDCGVGAPVASPRAYAGPCVSGWVASAFVRAVAN
ncbi:hypothetical protein ASG11_03950 [Sphingomonas sp. Leaf357]|nr:hypothetical protein ASG11_03950 [Sphingomonas sp. Leaf357]